MEETADERLDRLIRLEMSSRVVREERQSNGPELRRLRVENENPAGSGVAIEDRALNAGGQDDPMTRLVPLFDELALGPRGQTARDLQHDQGVFEGGRPDRALHNVADAQGQGLGLRGQGALHPGQEHHGGNPRGVVQVGQPEVPRLMEQGVLHPGQGHHSGDRQVGDWGQDHRRRSLSQEFAVTGGPCGSQPLMGHLHEPGLELNQGLRPMDQGHPVVVPMVNASGNPEVELLPQESGHGLDLGSAMVWTQRQLSGLARSAGEAMMNQSGLRQGAGQVHPDHQPDRLGPDQPDRREVLDPEVERIRQRCLQEAEARYQLELRRLRGEEVASYHTASSGGQGELPGHRHPVHGEEGRAQAGAAAQPVTSPGLGRSGPEEPFHPPGLAGARDRGTSGGVPMSPGYGPSPTRIDQQLLHGGAPSNPPGLAGGQDVGAGVAWVWYFPGKGGSTTSIWRLSSRWSTRRTASCQPSTSCIRRRTNAALYVRGFSQGF